MVYGQTVEFKDIARNLLRNLKSINRYVKLGFSWPAIDSLWICFGYYQYTNLSFEKLPHVHFHTWEMDMSSRSLVTQIILKKETREQYIYIYIYIYWYLDTIIIHSLYFPALNKNRPM